MKRGLWPWTLRSPPPLSLFFLSLLLPESERKGKGKESEAKRSEAEQSAIARSSPSMPLRRKAPSRGHSASSSSLPSLASQSHSSQSDIGTTKLAHSNLPFDAARCDTSGGGDTISSSRGERGGERGWEGGLGFGWVGLSRVSAWEVERKGRRWR